LIRGGKDAKRADNVSSKPFENDAGKNTQNNSSLYIHQNLIKSREEKISAWKGWVVMIVSFLVWTARPCREGLAERIPANEKAEVTSSPP